MPNINDTFTKYPHGYTIFESLADTVSIVNDMGGMLNDLIEGEIGGFLYEAIDRLEQSGELEEILVNIITGLIIIDGGEF